MTLTEKIIKNNKYVHDKVSFKYNKRHSEIYNIYEQERIAKVIKGIISYLNNDDIKVLDYGSGTGNLTHFFLENKCRVTSLDVSKESLNVLLGIYNDFKDYLTTKEFNGGKIPFKDEDFDIVVTYSVLHHVPNYIDAVKEMIRCLKKGGILYIDHEANRNKWNPSLELKKYYKLTNNIFKKIKNIIISGEIFECEFWRGVFIRNFIDNRYRNEGDLHVFKDDYIDWDLIKKILEENNMKIIEENDYLLYNSNISLDKFNKYKNKINDTKFIIAKKI